MTSLLIFPFLTFEKTLITKKKLCGRCSRTCKKKEQRHLRNNFLLLSRNVCDLVTSIAEIASSAIGSYRKVLIQYRSVSWLLNSVAVPKDFEVSLDLDLIRRVSIVV